MDTTPSPYIRDFRIAADHPCLPGHFPGHPLVPGVVLLEQVALGLRDWRGERVTRVVDAKFVAALGPGEDARVELESTGSRVRFRIHRGTTVIARGSVEGQA